MTNEELRDATVTRKAEKRRNRKLRNLMFVCAICAIVLAASTYAWFTANTRVTVSTLDVKVEAKNGLQISTNAVDWKSVISNEDYNTLIEYNKNL